MKIVHIDLSDPFTEDFAYQENTLIKYNKIDGHDVTLIATCYEWKNGKIIEVNPVNKYMSNGVHIVRLPYKKFINSSITKKIRYAPDIIDVIQKISPDVIMLHRIQTLSAFDIIKYIKHKNIKFYCDSHTDYHNSAKNILSKFVLHKFFYKFIAKLIAKNVNKIFCCSYECMFFLENMYHIPANKLEFYPLGGQCKTDYIYNEVRNRIRAKEHIPDDTILYIHSGKMDVAKRTKEIVKAFNSISQSNAILYIIGSMQEDIAHNVMPFVNRNAKIKFLGWKTGEELGDYLCAADVYLQLGSQSATMQNAACLRCALALYPYSSHKYLWGEDKVFYVESEEDMEQLFKNISEHPEVVNEMRQRSYEHAEEILDYRKLAARLYK